MALEMHSLEAREKRQRTLAAYRRIEDEDVLICRRNGLVPLAIADRLNIGIRRGVTVLEEAGEEVPGYLITNSPPPVEPRCKSCGR